MPGLAGVPGAGVPARPCLWLVALLSARRRPHGPAAAPQPL